MGYFCAQYCDKKIIRYIFEHFQPWVSMIGKLLSKYNIACVVFFEGFALVGQWKPIDKNHNIYLPQYCNIV